LEHWLISYLLAVLIYNVLTELLDLIFNARKIDQLLKHSDHFDIETLEKNHKTSIVRQSKLNRSNLMELDRQIKYIRQAKNDNNLGWNSVIQYVNKPKIIAAKEISDIFKIK
jgi:hypothetical protein